MKIAWIKEISWKKLLLVGIIYTVVTLVVRQLEAILTMKYYLMPEYFGVWSKIMMPTLGPPPTEFMITSAVLTFVTGISLVLVYYYLRNHLPKETKRRVFYFADILVATSFIFFTLPVYLMFNVPAGLLVSWFVSSFIILLTGSFITVRIIK